MAITVSSCVKVVLIVGSLVAFVAAVFLNAYFNIPGLSPFNESIADISHKYDTGITPTDSTFAIWGLIYSWLLAAAVYSQTLLCRKSYGAPLYIEPGFIPPTFYVSFIITMIGNPGWIVTFLTERLQFGAGLLVLGIATAVVCLVSSCQQLDLSGAEMTKQGLVADIWCTRIIVQNACALYGGWVSCATVLNFIEVLYYDYKVSMDTCCYGGLAVLNVIILAWFVVETFMKDRELRYVFAQYIAYLAALSGSYKQHYNPQLGYTQYGLVLLILTAVLAAAKLVVMIVRGIKDPIVYKPTLKH